MYENRHRIKVRQSLVFYGEKATTALLNDDLTHGLTVKGGLKK